MEKVLRAREREPCAERKRAEKRNRLLRNESGYPKKFENFWTVSKDKVGRKN